MNWISERWLPIEIEFKGEVKFGKLPKKWTKDQLTEEKMSEQVTIGSNSLNNSPNKTLTQITSLTSAKEFIEKGVIKLTFSQIKVKPPVFIFLEFDD